MFQRGGQDFPFENAGPITWGRKSGRFAVAVPSVVYNAKENRRERFPHELKKGGEYELFASVGSRLIYYGTYKCVEKVKMHWSFFTTFHEDVSIRSWTRGSHFLTR